MSQSHSDFSNSSSSSSSSSSTSFSSSSSVILINLPEPMRTHNINVLPENDPTVRAQSNSNNSEPHFSGTIGLLEPAPASLRRDRMTTQQVPMSQLIGVIIGMSYATAALGVASKIVSDADGANDFSLGTVILITAAFGLLDLILIGELARRAGFFNRRNNNANDDQQVLLPPPNPEPANDAAANPRPSV